MAATSKCAVSWDNLSNIGKWWGRQRSWSRQTLSFQSCTFFLCKISFVRGQVLCDSLTNFQHYFWQRLSIWWQVGIAAVVNEQPRCFWLTGEICLGCLELNCRALLLLVRRLLSCFIERCPWHLLSLTVCFYQGLPHDLNAQPMGCCNSLSLTPPSTSSAS